MKLKLAYALLSGIFSALILLPLAASAREVALPAGTLLQCTLNEPNFSSATVDVGDPVLCHLRSVTEFGQQAFPRGSYLVGHLESAKDPGHFVGKGSLKLQFDRIGLPTGDLPLEAKVIATRGYRVDKEGKIIGRGHATRDVVEWMLPPLWPWKVIMLPARGPRPKLKGETSLTLRLMDDVVVPQIATTFGPGWHFFGEPQSQSFPDVQSGDLKPTLALRDAAVAQAAGQIPQASYATLVSRELPSRAPVIISSDDNAGVALAAATAPGVPVFVLKTGTVLSVADYTYRDGRITYTLASGGGGVITADQIDWTTTTHINTAHGVRVTLRGGHQSPATSGL